MHPRQASAPCCTFLMMSLLCVLSLLPPSWLQGAVAGAAGTVEDSGRSIAAAAAARGQPAHTHTHDHTTHDHAASHGHDPGHTQAHALGEAEAALVVAPAPPASSVSQLLEMGFTEVVVRMGGGGA